MNNLQIKKSVNKITELKYHNTHKKKAMFALNNIEKDTNYSLSLKEKSYIKNYAKERFGSTKYAYWLYVYTAFNQEFKEGWIPDNYFGLVVAPAINNGLGKLANVKTMTNRLINSSILPDKIYKINNQFYDRNNQFIEDEVLEDLLFDDKKNEYFVKKDDSNQGRGVFRLTYNNFDMNYFKKLNNFVIQSSIKQNPFFDEIVKGSVATVRVTTVKVKNKIETRGYFLRVGREGSASINSESYIRVPIKNIHGELGEHAIDVNWQRLYKHPDTSFTFEGKKIPGFYKATKELEKIHEKFPHFSIIGWDISITEDENPQIIEWNADHPDVKFTEATIGPTFKDLNWESLSK